MLRWGRHCQRERGKLLRIYDRPSRHKVKQQPNLKNRCLAVGGGCRNVEMREQVCGLVRYCASLGD